jgi:hypothetical protein
MTELYEKYDQGWTLDFPQYAYLMAAKQGQVLKYFACGPCGWAAPIYKFSESGYCGRILHSIIAQFPVCRRTIFA